MVKPTRADLAALARKWVKESCDAQDLAVKVEDTATVDAVAGLLGAPAEDVA